MPLSALVLSMPPTSPYPWPFQALKALQDMSSTAPPAPLQPSTRKAKTIPVQAFEVHGRWGFMGQRAVGGEGGAACLKVLSAASPLLVFQVKLDVTLGDLTKIGKSQKFTLSVDVEGGRLVLLRRQRDSQEDWTTFTHDRSEPGQDLGEMGRVRPLAWRAQACVTCLLFP